MIANDGVETFITVGELRALLEKYPQDAKIGYLWDGAVRTQASHVFLSKTGGVVIGGCNEYAYYDSGRPGPAPKESENDSGWRLCGGRCVEIEDEFPWGDEY